MSLDVLTIADIANYAGWTIATARHNHAVATRRRRDGDTRPGDLPAPDARIGRSPVWHRATIEEWAKNRPGSGAHNRRRRLDA